MAMMSLTLTPPSAVGTALEPSPEVVLAPEALASAVVDAGWIGSTVRSFAGVWSPLAALPLAPPVAEFAPAFPEVAEAD
jgi:hypothetical protein